MSSATSARSANLKLVNQSATLAMRLSVEDAKMERALMETKWFDYRFMSPLDATEQFAQEYRKAYQLKWRTNFATDEASKKLAFQGGDWRKSPTEFTSCWRARQRADFFGVPYGFFCERALELYLRRGYARPPRPNQLYSGKTIAMLVAGIQKEWREHCDGVQLMISLLPQYHSDSFIGDRVQCAHQDWVVEIVRERHMDPRCIARACFELCVLPVDRAHFEFGPRRVERAREHAESERIVPVIARKLESHEFRPSCFGIVHSFDPSEADCARCAFKAPCKTVTDTIADHVRRACGDIDPVLARKRRLGRERVRRHRQRNAAPIPSIIPAGAGNCP